MTIDHFLVPKKRKQANNAKLMMMGCSDSLSCMPNTFDTATDQIMPNYRSKKRINKLLGKPSDGPMTRSRIQSKDFSVDEEWSNYSNLQDLKEKKRSKLHRLRNQDMFLMSA